MEQRLLSIFMSIFGDSLGACLFFSPGRVNLIGEHTDYNGGHVFPCALTLGTYCVIRKRSDRIMRFYSDNFKEAGVIEVALDDIAFNKSRGWANYALGVIWVLKEKGISLDKGFEMAVYGNLPNGTGLSSSASLEVLMCKAVSDLYDKEISPIDMALVSQRAENAYVGMNCGIMDQFAISMGKYRNAIFLDTATLEYEYVPIRLENKSLLIMNTNKRRALSDSSYNERRDQCEHAVEQLRQAIDISTLGQLDEQTFLRYSHLVTDPVERRRAKHAVYENQRAIMAVELLQKGDITDFGKLMNQSHISLRDDYQVTGPELDTIVEAAWAQKGVIGARMTGAGFGGCAISIVDNDNLDEVKDKVGEIYWRTTQIMAEFYTVAIGGGPCQL